MNTYIHIVLFISYLLALDHREVPVVQVALPLLDVLEVLHFLAFQLNLVLLVDLFGLFVPMGPVDHAVLVVL